MATPPKLPFCFSTGDLQFKRVGKCLESGMGRWSFFQSRHKHSKGTLILVNPKITCKVEKQICDKNGRYIILDLVLADKRIVLVNIYAPNDVNQQVSFFKELQEQPQEISEKTIIIGNDFNCPLSETDKKGGSPNSWKQRVVEEINNLCNLYDLNDIWPFLNPSVDQFTWRNKSFKIQCCLDFYLISKKTE